MAPHPQGQSMPARSGPNPKKHSASPSTSSHNVAVPNNRQHVIPAIPLALMHRQPKSVSKAAAKPTPAHAPALTASSPSNAHPVSLPNAALTHDGSDPSSHGPEGGVKLQNAESFEHAVLPSIGNEQNTPSSEWQANASTNGDTEVPSTARATPDTNHSSYPSQPHSTTSVAKADFPTSFLPPPVPVHQQPMGDQRHHYPAFHAPHPHHMHNNHHRHQMSNGGNIMFGVPDSHTPSPAPHPGAFLPPPHPALNGENRGNPVPGGHHHAHTNSNGFPGPINTHFRADLAPISTVDAYGTVSAAAQGQGHPHFETLPPGASRYGPQTPHSFHGSHASADHNGMENAPPPYPPNGSYAPPGRHEPPMGRPHHPFPPFMLPQPVSRQYNMAEDGTIEGINYFRNLFGNGELSDCSLELIYAKSRHHPVKISGHKIILARSPTLKQAILTARPNGQNPPMIRMEIDDPYLRSDSWWTALQHLYMHPLIQPPPMLRNGPNGFDYAGDKIDRFEFCLGYAAAGHILAMPDIVIRGLSIAAYSLTWETVESALGFVLHNTVQRNHNDDATSEEENSLSAFLEFGYGPETKLLLVAIMDFLINEFPSNFEFDSSASDNPKIARIPGITTAPAVASPPLTSALPAIARGTASSQNHNHGRLSSIKFGDLPVANPDDGVSPQRQPAKYSTILSRILLNLPYDELARVLTSGSQGVSGWNTAQDRYHAVANVVAEREARRLRAVEAVRSGSAPHAHDIQLRLSSPRRYAVADEWDVLNWVEEVLPGEAPRIMRRWVPQFSVAQQPSRDQVLPSYDVTDSMV
ncbi:hypothetical protein GGS20DRAFT_216135 [Poronia punctata]|nr:hypothetical protein GGS20DRAFT_216135 [Poronia punctata]